MSRSILTTVLILVAFQVQAWQQDFVIEWQDQSTANKFVVGYKLDNGRWVGKAVPGNSVDGAVLKQTFTADVNVGTKITPRAKAGKEITDDTGKKVTKWSAFTIGQPYIVTASDQPPAGTPSVPTILRIYVVPSGAQKTSRADNSRTLQTGERNRTPARRTRAGGG